MRKKLIFVLVVLLLALISYGYYWASGIIKENMEAKTVLLESKKFKLIKESVLKEYNRCQVFITQKEGDFGSFEYCKKFIQWSKDAPIQ